MRNLKKILKLPSNIQIGKRSLIIKEVKLLNLIFKNKEMNWLKKEKIMITCNRNIKNQIDQFWSYKTEAEQHMIPNKEE